MNKKYISAIIGLASVASLAAALPVSAQTVSVTAQSQPSGQGHDDKGGPDGMRPVGQNMRMVVRPGVFGTVSAINGAVLTVTVRQGFGTTTSSTKTFTVDASGATVKKNNATSTLSAISVGDMVAVQGAVTGTNVVATLIRDGLEERGGKPGFGMHPGEGMATSTPVFSGNGEPVVAGSVSSVSGTSITISNKSNVIYTVDASNAKILDGEKASTLASISVGDSLIVQGTVNGSSIVATTIIDQVRPSMASTSPKREGNGMPHGILGGVGAFFGHLFGF